MAKRETYHEHLIKSLRDPKEAFEYLNAALEEGDKNLFLIALRNVAEAQGGITQLARQSKLSRVNLYRMMSKNGNPGITSLMRILSALGFQLMISESFNPGKQIEQTKDDLILQKLESIEKQISTNATQGQNTQQKQRPLPDPQQQVADLGKEMGLTFATNERQIE